MSVRVEPLLALLVRDEVQALEGNVHHELREVAAVERAHALDAQHRAPAFRARLVRGVVDLHALLDDCEQRRDVQVCRIHNIVAE